MSVQRIQSFLDLQGARYVVIRHSPAFTAQEVAASAHIPGKDMIKVVVVRIDGRLAIAAVPARRNVDTERLLAAAGAQTVEIADEREFAFSFPGCHLGAMPPIGAPFGMDVYMERDLAKEKYIAFSAGTHSEVIAMEFGDYRRVAHPKLAHISAVPQDSPLLTAQI